MTDINQFHDSLNIEPPVSKKIPDMLNVLTILSYIGCALGLFFSIYGYFTACKSADQIGEIENADNPMAGMMTSVAESTIKQCELKLPILIIGLLSLAVCFIGVYQMRKLKKPGFYLYVIGELAAPIAGIIMIGAGVMGVIMTIMLIFPIVFIILYATQLKHMK